MSPRCATCDLVEFPLCPGPCGVDEASAALRHRRAKYLASTRLDWPMATPSWADVHAVAQAAYEQRITRELESVPDGLGASEPDPGTTTAATNAIYRLQVLGARPSSASMQFTVNGQPTDPFRTLNSWSGRSAAEAQRNTESAVGAGNVTCTGGEPPSGQAVTFEFAGTLAGTAVAMRMSSSTFSGGAYELVTVQTGGPGVSIPAGSVRRPRTDPPRYPYDPPPEAFSWPPC